MKLGGFYRKNTIGRTLELYEEKLKEGFLISIYGEIVFIGEPETPHDRVSTGCLIKREDFIQGYDLVIEPQYDTIKVIRIGNRLFGDNPIWAEKGTLNEVTSF